MTLFFGGISCFHTARSYSGNHKLVELATSALNAIKQKEHFSSWNYTNKRLLLEAEMYSAANKKVQAKAAYDAAIAASQSSKFVHEQGLACEMAALHYWHSECDFKTSNSLFQQALACYTEWECKPKIDAITRKIEKL